MSTSGGKALIRHAIQRNRFQTGAPAYDYDKSEVEDVGGQETADIKTWA